MKIGITGSRNGKTTSQTLALHRLFTANVWWGATNELHHGDCIGVDVQVANICKAKGMYVVSHPPINSKYRAFHASDVVLEPKEYKHRNQDIVDEYHVLVVVPKEMQESRYGGTWQTYRMAKAQEKSIYIIYPNGEIIHQ